MADVDAPVIGFRTWPYHSEEGLGGNYGYYWLPGQNKAVCRSGAAQGTPLWNSSFAFSPEPHRAVHPPGEGVPHPDCMCGLYGRHVPGKPWLTSGELLGAIFGWGEMEVTADGFRCEFASVAMLAYNPHGGKGHLRQASEVADEFDVPLVEVPDLKLAAFELGAPVPVELRPKPRKASAKPNALIPGSSHIYYGFDPGVSVGTNYLTPLTPAPRRKRWLWWRP